MRVSTMGLVEENEKQRVIHDMSFAGSKERGWESVNDTVGGES